VFDLRYHLASLAAVFVAIAVGIVIGVAIASGGEVEKATLDLREREIESLNEQLDAAQAEADHSERQKAAIEDLMEQVYPEVMASRLADRRIALLFLGPVEGQVRSAVEGTLTDTGAGAPERVAALEFPIDVEAIDAILASDPALEGYRGDAQLGALGEALAAELSRGGETPLWDALSSELVEERTGALDQPVDGVAVARTWEPEETADPAVEGRNNQTEALIVGLLRGLGGLGIPIVGVESSGKNSSTIEDYRKIGGVSSVDDIDELPGRVALALLLAGGQPGHYGTKETATDGVAPRIEPLTVAAVAE
jgi:hypothetical protein